MHLSLLIEIARCPNVTACLSSPGRAHPCAAIVGSQHNTASEFQLPEPWSGHLGTAPVLFLGSNPGIAETEEYPLGRWPDESVVDFFTYRFGGGSRVWVKDGLRTLLRDGTYKRNWVRYWAGVRKRASELLGRDRVVPGVDYVMSEVVHCKSRSEQGVGEAADECVKLYLRRLVAESAARVVVSLGRFPEHAVRREFCVPDAVSLYGPVEVGGHSRYFVFLPHPNAFAPKTIAKCLSPDDIVRLRRFLVTRLAQANDLSAHRLRPRRTELSPIAGPAAEHPG